MLKPGPINKVIIVLSILALVTACCEPIPSNRQIGIVRAVGPEVYLNKKLVRDGAPLFNNNHVATGTKSSIEVIFNRGGFVQLNENADPTFEEFFDAAKCIIRVVLEVGEIFAENSQSCSIETETPNVLVTQHSQLNIRVGGGATTISVLKGNATFAELGNAGLRASEQATIRNGRITSRRTLSRQEQLELVRWRDRYTFPKLIRNPNLKQLDLHQGERPGTPVDVTVASKKWTTVPNLTGQTLRRARELLRGAELVPGNVVERDPRGAPSGTVIGQSVRTGDRLLAGRTVDIVVAREPHMNVPERAWMDTVRRYYSKPRKN